MVDLSTFSDNVDSTRFEKAMQSTPVAGVKPLYISNKGIPKKIISEIPRAEQLMSDGRNIEASLYLTEDGLTPAYSFIGDWISNSSQVLVYYQPGYVPPIIPVEIGINFTNQQVNLDNWFDLRDADSTGLKESDIPNFNDGSSTGISLSVSTAFTSSSNGEGVSVDQHGIPAIIWDDNFYTNSIAVFTLSGFTPNQQGTLLFGGESGSATRDVNVSINGDTYLYNASGDFNSLTAPTEVNFTADGSGNLVIQVAPTSDFGYLAFLKLSWIES